jgi:hypothetical protein
VLIRVYPWLFLVHLLPVLTVPGVRVEYAERDAGQARRTAEIVRGVEAEVAARLGVRVPDPVDVALAESDPAFDRIFASLGGRGRPPEWALAVAIPDAAAIVVRTTRLEAFTENDLRLTLAHELAHLALGQLPRLPRWLDEGLAEWASGRRLTPAERTSLERLARAGTLATLDELEDGFPLYAEEAHVAYVESLAFVEALAASPGEPEPIPRLLRAVAAGTPFPRAFERTFDAPLRGVEIGWRADLASRYSIVRDLFERGSLYTLVAILAIVAFVRYRRKRAHLLAAMGEPPPPPEYPRGERDIEGDDAAGIP